MKHLVVVIDRKWVFGFSLEGRSHRLQKVRKQWNHLAKGHTYSQSMGRTSVECYMVPISQKGL